MKTFSMSPSDAERTDEVSCVVCGSVSDRPYWDCGSFGFVRCSACGHVYQNPQPVFDDLQNRYQDDYFDYELENDASFLDLMLRGLSDIDFDALTESLPRPRRFLDVGCATGALLQHLKTEDWQVEGVEICVPAAEYGRTVRNVDIHVGTLDRIEFTQGLFDVVHYSHVIEHVPDPRQFLRDVWQVLRPGGYTIIVTPNTSGFQAKLFGARWRSAIADHLNLFSTKNLKRIVLESGFDVVAHRTWGGVAQGMAPRWIKHPADRLAKPLGFGDVVLVLAQKPLA
ncbi:MAG: class I SAM-dependent methyltransferase [Spirochaetaceae bacterium]|nr:MAG: class I SAM-dependent methyltransferase [Spirochaetaceae bacterium]